MQQVVPDNTIHFIARLHTFCDGGECSGYFGEDDQVQSYQKNTFRSCPFPLVEPMILEKANGFNVPSSP